MKRIVWFGILLGLIALYALAIRGAAALINGDRQVPTCQEDQVLVGMGPFDDGRWESYTCGPSVDDYVPR